jgi:hypothetical protein
MDINSEVRGVCGKGFLLEDATIATDGCGSGLAGRVLSLVGDEGGVASTKLREGVQR